ncbi:hypothetical protein ACIGHG_00045 [Bacillus sp. NPDC077411]|uniref:hypothetical protein n=1 Tax=Bacillus sp. NPDC077411 TaxID=3363947 RepID=UPI0037CC9051
MKQLFYYFFASILIFSLIGCSSHTSKTELMIFKDNEIEHIKLLKSQNDDGHLITSNAQTTNESLIKAIVKTIKDGSPIKSRLDEKEKKSLHGEMEINFKNGSKEILSVLINDKNEISVLKESGEGYKLKDNVSKLVTGFFLGSRELEKN